MVTAICGMVCRLRRRRSPRACSQTRHAPLRDLAGARTFMDRRGHLGSETRAAPGVGFLLEPIDPATGGTRFCTGARDQGERPMLGDHPITPVLLAKDLAASRDFYH